MPHEWLSPWESFYVIVGSSAAALTGLQFVVIALIAEVRPRTSSQTLAAFGTPNVVHFCAALLVSAVLSAPWPSILGVRETLGAIGVVGLGYAVIIAIRAGRQTGYRPVLEDWIWHAILPTTAYGGIFVAAMLLGRGPVVALFVVGAMTLLLVFIGIHNAWDTVTFITMTYTPAAKAGDGARGGETPAAPPTPPTPPAPTPTPESGASPESRIPSPESR